MTEINLDTMTAAELALISKMPHVDMSVRHQADRMLEALIGRKNARSLRAAAWEAIDNVSATDAALYAEAQA